MGSSLIYKFVRKFRTYSNYSPIVLSLCVYLKEYLSCDREIFPFLKHTFDADDVAGKYLYIHNLEVDQNLHSYATTTRNLGALTFLSKYRFTVAKHGLPASYSIKRWESSEMLQTRIYIILLEDVYIPIRDPESPISSMLK